MVERTERGEEQGAAAVNRAKSQRPIEAREQNGRWRMMHGLKVAFPYIN